MRIFALLFFALTLLPGSQVISTKSVFSPAKGLALQRTFADSVSRWSSIGPAPIQNGLIPGAGPTSGRVDALAVDPTNPNTLYIGASSGGVWKSANAGASWSPLTDQQCSLAIGNLAIDPINPKIIYAAIGPQQFTGFYQACGLIKSTDGGLTWTQHPSSIAGPYSKIIIDPATAGSTTGTRVYFATDQGLYLSLDSGATSTKIFAPYDSLSMRSTDLAVDLMNPNILYAAVNAVDNNTFVSSFGIFRSADSGATWTQRTNGLPATGKVFALAVAKSSSDILYTAIGPPIRLFRSGDKGANWMELLPTGIDPRYRCCGIPLLQVDRNDPQTLYWGSTFGDLFRSRDGGQTWASISLGVDFRGIHTDQRVLVSPYSAGLYVGNDGGVWRSVDYGDHWTDLNTNLAITQFYPGVSFHPTGIILGGTQDNGTLKYNGTNVWTTVFGGDGSFTAIDKTNPDTFYFEAARFSSALPLFYRTDNGGTTFTLKVNGIDPTEVGNTAVFVSDPSDSKTLLYATTRVYRTTDRAERWTGISPQFQYPVASLAVAPSSSSTLYAVEALGTVWVSKDTGANWSRATSGLPVNGGSGATDLAVDPSNSDVAYLTFVWPCGPCGPHNGLIFRTSNGGTTWVDISGNLPKDKSAFSVVLDPSVSPPALYVGTDVGVFRSLDGGTNWNPFNDGLPRVVVMDLVLDTQSRVLVASTFGRGMFAITVSPILSIKKVRGQITSQ